MAFAPPAINVSDFDFHVGSATGQTLRLRKRAFKALIPLNDFRFNNVEGLSLSIVLNRLVLFHVLDVGTKPPSYYS